MVIQNTNRVLLLQRLWSRLLAIEASFTGCTWLVSGSRIRLLMHGCSLTCCSSRLCTWSFCKFISESNCSLSFLLSQLRLRLCSCSTRWLKRLVSSHIRVPVLIEDHVIIVLRHIALQAVMLA